MLAGGAGRAHGGAAGYPMHGPADAPETEGQLAHVHGKLLSLRDRMYTEQGRALAEERHAYLEAFAERFAAELRGER